MTSTSVNSPLPIEPSAHPGRYGRVSMALHWIMAALILVELGLGWYLNEVLPDRSAAQHQMEAIHISIGLTFLLLVLVRIVVRLTHPAPQLPEGLAHWERALSRFTHALFYVLMLLLPLSAWLLLSVRDAEISFWGIGWPALPLPEDLPESTSRVLKSVHTYWLIWFVVLNLALHVAGALKHQFDGHPVLWRMLPFLRRPSNP